MESNLEFILSLSLFGEMLFTRR